MIHPCRPVVVCVFTVSPPQARLSLLLSCFTPAGQILHLYSCALTLQARTCICISIPNKPDFPFLFMLYPSKPDVVFLGFTPGLPLALLCFTPVGPCIGLSMLHPCRPDFALEFPRVSPLQARLCICTSMIHPWQARRCTCFHMCHRRRPDFHCFCHVSPLQDKICSCTPVLRPCRPDFGFVFLSGTPPGRTALVCFYVLPMQACTSMC